MFTKNVNIFKAISVKKMKELLDRLPADYLLSPNEVRNIAILDAQEKYIGAINIVDETIDRMW